MDDELQSYMSDRVDDQLGYFDSSAMRNQKSYRRLKWISIVCNIMTTMFIALAFTVPQEFKTGMSIVALILSTTVLATYQIEEFQSFGAKWEKFRLVAEQIKSEKFMFLNRVGRYSVQDDVLAKNQFIETIENIIKGTDISYFSLMVEPGKRIEKRLEQKQGD